MGREKCLPLIERLRLGFPLTRILLFASWFPVFLLLKLSTSLLHLLTLCDLIFLWHAFYYSILKYQIHESIRRRIFSNLVISSWILWSLIRCIRIYVHVFMTRGEAILLKGFMHYCLSFKIGVDFLILQKSLVVASWPGSMMQCDRRESSIGCFNRFMVWEHDAMWSQVEQYWSFQSVHSGVNEWGEQYWSFQLVHSGVWSGPGIGFNPFVI